MKTVATLSTVGGAIVEYREPGLLELLSPDAFPEWKCTGCRRGANGWGYQFGTADIAAEVRREAREHAAACRDTPS